ncbi:peptidase domain-containing ABC transporter [uncultured Rhodoblastus sp.]|uniref:peptidase domain-containing ABC transporter n=1 Tax=uncultured Rhodoblastus sp. TaxID=543037 RepID=UPI0025DAD3FC|nr:peptidase domain-containing ABC transporter [uncultured Rhodoblastus sp.]
MNDSSAFARSSALDCLVVVGGRHGLHLTARQIVQDNALPSEDLTESQLVHCARGCGLKAKSVRLDWNGVAGLQRALPAIVRLNSGAWLVLEEVHQSDGAAYVLLRDPKGGEQAVFKIDRPRFEEAWSGDVVLARRDYDIKDEEQPFDFGLIVSLIFRERGLVRDLCISAVFLSFFALAPIFFWRILSDKVIYYRSMSTFAVVCIAMGLVIVLETVFTFLRGYLLQIITARVDVRLSEYMFEKVLHLPIDFFERRQVGLINRDMNEIYRIRAFLTGQLFGTLLDSLTLLFFLPVMFAYSVVLTSMVLACCALIVAWLLYMLPAYRKAYGAVLTAEGERGAFLVQSISGIRTIKSLALEPRQLRQWDVHIARIARLRMKEGFVANLIQTGVKPIERLAVNGTFAYGVYLALTTNDPVFVGSLFIFIMLSQRVAAPLMQMAQLVNQLDEARGAVAMVGNMVNRPPEAGHSHHGVRTPLEGHVAFSKVRFTYPGANSPAILDLSFDVPVGTTLGVVGRSGSGKTTVTRLLQRLHPDYEGLIKIDGVDVRSYDLAHLRRSLGVVLQENYLFSGTIRENITAAKSNATFDEICRAARLAGAEEFIERLPHGYDTWIYEGSPNLSGGQRQRLAIARALIVDPRILILDEATSALDPDSEAIVNANIKRIAQGRTVIVISHRLSSLVNSDAIMVLEQGALLDIGTHAELLEKCEIYRTLWNQQNGHIEAAMRKTQLTRGPFHAS